MTTQTPDAVREALQKGLEFVVVTLAFLSRDRGTNRESKTLDGLQEEARKLEPVMREALAALDSRAGDAGEGCDLCLGSGRNTHSQLWPDHPPACRACNGTGFLATPAPAVDAPVMIPREPTQAMMDAGLYHSSHDTEWADVHTMWKAMFDAVTLDGGVTDSAPADAATSIKLDGNDIWETLFGITRGSVPDGMTEDVCQRLAEALIEAFKPDAAPAVDAVPAGEADTYTRWLAGDETLPTLSREQYLRFQACSDRAIKNRRRTPQTVADRVAEVRRNPDDADWDHCPACKTGSLDTGYECNACGFDAQPLVHLRDACEARGERMHPSGLYESEIAHPFLAALSHGEGRK